MVETTVTTPAVTPLLGSPRRILALMAAALAVSAAVAFGSITSQEPTAVGAAVDGRVDYAIRHLGEATAAEATPLNADYALRHMGEGTAAEAIPLNVDYALRHMTSTYTHSLDYALRHRGE